MPNVLLAEDEFLIRAVMVDALGSIGLDCIEAATGQAALEVIAGSTSLAAIIVDIGLPDMSGEKVIEAAQLHRPDVPIVRCSGANAPPGTANPKVHVFPKPYSPDELSKFIASLAGRT
jgi:CheY-like chemotaxis protein